MPATRLRLEIQVHPSIDSVRHFARGLQSRDRQWPVLDPMALMKEIKALRAAGVRVEGSGQSSPICS